MGFLQNKRALIVGVVNNYSIAYGIAKCMHREGAELAFSYQSERVKERVQKIAAELNSNLTFPCDLASDDEINKLFADLSKHWEHFDIVVHSAAFAPQDQLEGNFVDCVTREGFRIAHDISSYSFAALAKASRRFMQGRNGALLTLTHLGAERSINNYNVMGLAKASLESNVRYLASAIGPEGIRVNGISAGAIRTLAASGVKDLRKLMAVSEKISPLRKNVSTEEVGNVAAFLCSDLALGITGEIIHVDAGFSTLGSPGVDI